MKHISIIIYIVPIRYTSVVNYWSTTAVLKIKYIKYLMLITSWAKTEIVFGRAHKKYQGFMILESAPRQNAG